jgi:hypothetical protein
MEEPPGRREWVPTHRIAIDGNTDRIPKHIGDHLWTWTAVFRASPGTETPMLDSENLIRIIGIMCFFCGREYSKRVDARLCPGPPR